MFYLTVCIFALSQRTVVASGRDGHWLTDLRDDTIQWLVGIMYVRVVLASILILDQEQHQKTSWV